MTSMPSHLSLSAMPTVLAVLVFLTKATLLLLLACIGAAALRRASAGTRHILWAGALAALVSLPALSYWTPWRLAIVPSALGTLLDAPRGAARMTTPMNEASAPTTSIAATGTAAAPGGTGSRSAAGLPPVELASPTPSAFTGSPSSVHEHGARTSIDVWLALVVLWAAGALVLLGRFAAGTFAVGMIVRGARPLEDPDWTGPLWEVADRLELAHAPRLLRADGVSMPFACGLMHPTIVLPHDADAWSDERRRAVLFHELAHVRRRDLVGHTLSRIACALYWFHPLVWTAARRLRAESERACDDLVLASGTRASDYADHLLQIVTGVRNAAAPAVALAMARRKEFEGRMLAILDPEQRRNAPSRLQAVGLVLGLAALAVSVSAMVPATRSDVGTGEHHRTRSIDQAVGSAVDTAVDPVVRETVAPVVDQTLSSFTDGRKGLTSVMDRRALDGMRRTIRDAVRERADEMSPSRSAHADSGATALLVQLLQSDSDAEVRRTAAWALAQRDERHAAAPLAAALEHDRSADVREMAAWGLGQSDGGAAAVQALGDAVQRDADEHVKATAAWALGQIGDDAAMPALDAAMADPSARVRARAAWALGQIEPRTAPRGLVSALGDSSRTVRLTAAWALGQIEDPRTLSALSAALAKEKDHGVREAELRAVLRLGDTSDAALRELLKSSDPDIRLRATRALAGYGTDAWPWPWPWPMPRPMP